MYISFRFYKSSMIYEYNEGESHPRQILKHCGKSHQSEINGNTLSLLVRHQAEQEIF